MRLGGEAGRRELRGLCPGSGSLDLSPPLPSPLEPWAPGDHERQAGRLHTPWFELMLEVTVVAVCVVPVSCVSQGGLEHTLCVGKGASNEVPAWEATVGSAAPSKLDSGVLWEGVVSGSRVPMLTDMVVPVEVVWCVSQGRPAGGCCPPSGWPAPPPEVAVVGVWVVPVSWVSQGGLEQTLWALPAFEVVAVLVVPVSWVSHGGLEQTWVTVAEEHNSASRAVTVTAVLGELSYTCMGIPRTWPSSPAPMAERAVVGVLVVWV